MYRPTRHLLTGLLLMSGLLGIACESDVEPRRQNSDAQWHRLPVAPAARGEGLSELQATRLGSRVIIVAGASFDATKVRALSFDLRLGRWRRLPPAPLRWRSAATSVGWKGRIIIWGGTSNRGALDDGAILDARSRSWSRLPRSPLRARSGHSAVWTGDQMIVWGGRARRGTSFSDGASYDPSTGRWRRLARSPLTGRSQHAAVWNGSKMIIWGGEVDSTRKGERQPNSRAEGAVYDHRRGEWRPIALAPIAWHKGARAVWTEQSMLVWTGTAGAIYKPKLDRWRRIAAAPLAPRDGFTAVWDGRRLLLWGGERRDCGDCFLADGAAYRPTTDRWRRLPDGPLAGRSRHAAAATPTGMIVWGGCCRRTMWSSDGAIYVSR